MSVKWQEDDPGSSTQGGLHEVDRKILQKPKEGDIVYRFFIDSSEKVYLHLWQLAKIKENKQKRFGIQKFQLSNEKWAFKWTQNSKLKFAHISEDNIPLKPKASPLMIMQQTKDQGAYGYFQRYLRRHSSEDIPELNFLKNMFGNDSSN